MPLWRAALTAELQYAKPALDLLAGAVLALLGAAGLAPLLGTGAVYGLAVMLGYGLLAACIWYAWPRQGWSLEFWRHWRGQSVLTLGAANRVTLGRAILVVLVFATLPFPALVQAHVWPLTALCLLALALDGVDGWVARRTGSDSAFGARFDMEVDAALILVLTVLLLMLERAGIWVLAIGLMRYVFVLAGAFWRWLKAPLPARSRRQWVCVWQVATLIVCLPPLLPGWAATTALLLALVLLVYSFGADIVWLYRYGREYEQV